MQQAIDAMNTALRVLNALAIQHNAEPQDVDELRRLAPLLRYTRLDELAWEIIRQAMKCRAALLAVDSSRQAPGEVEGAG